MLTHPLSLQVVDVAKRIGFAKQLEGH